MTFNKKPWREVTEMHPSDYIRGYTDEMGIDPDELHTHIGVSKEEFEPLLYGPGRVTPKIAAGLEAFLGHLGYDADFWIRLQDRYDETVARNDAREAAGINTKVYKVTDTDGRIVKYGVATDFADAIYREGIHHNNYDIRNLTWYLHSDVAQRKLDKLQRALEARRRRERETAAERSAARTTASDARELAARAA